MPNTASVTVSKLAIGALPPHVRLEAWREGMDVLADVLPHSDFNPERFDVTVEAHLLHNTVFARSSIGAQKYVRNVQRIGRDGLDHYDFYLFLSGKAEIQIGRRRIDTWPGTLLCLDLTEPMICDSGHVEVLNIFVPRHALAPLLLHPESVHGVVLDRSRGASRIAMDFALSIDRTASHLTAEQRTQTAGMFVQLLAMALNEGTNARRPVPEPEDIDLAIRAQRLVSAQIANRVLTPAWLAQELGVSRSRLYDVFTQHSGIAHYIRRSRLKAAHAALRNPAQQHMSVAQIAFATGFDDPLHFSRLFRRHYGLPPSALRPGTGAAGSAMAPGGLPPDVGDGLYIGWIKNLA